MLIEKHKDANIQTMQKLLPKSHKLLVDVVKKVIMSREFAKYRITTDLQEIMCAIFKKQKPNWAKLLLYRLAKAVEATQMLYKRVLSIILKEKLTLSNKNGKAWTAAKHIDVKKIGKQSVGFVKKGKTKQTTSIASAQPLKEVVEK